MSDRNSSNSSSSSQTGLDGNSKTVQCVGTPSNGVCLGDEISDWQQPFWNSDVSSQRRHMLLAKRRNPGQVLCDSSTVSGWTHSQSNNQLQDSGSREAAENFSNDRSKQFDEAFGEAGSDSQAVQPQSPFTNGEFYADSSSNANQDCSTKMSTPQGGWNNLTISNLIEKAIMDFCSTRTLETMRRAFSEFPDELDPTQHNGRPGERSALVSHTVTGELVKEGIIIGNIDVFAPQVHKEFCLKMKDSLVEGFLNDSAIFRSICLRTKCQLEITRRLLNKKLCAGGRWVKFLIVRIVGPSFRAISTCDKLLQKTVPSYMGRMDYSRTACCRMFFREDIPDNTTLYHNMQRTGGTSYRFGSLRLDTPYKTTAARNISNCPWKSGAMKVGKLAFSGSGSNKCMKQVYPGYGHLKVTPMAPESKGISAVDCVERMQMEAANKRNMLFNERRNMTIAINR